MEFYEKLRELRKCKGLTQEELAEALYVSRAAVSKWESGRGYPGIDSLKQIAAYFNITIDELLSTDALLSIAEKENRINLQRTYDMLLGITDLFAILLIILPLYPETVEGYVYAVNLPAYCEIASWRLPVYWGMFAGLTAAGVLKILTVKRGTTKGNRIITDISTGISIAALIFLVISRETYASAMLVMMLTIKMILLLKYVKASA